MHTAVNSRFASSVLAELTARSASEQRQAGYADTLREILQQPTSWQATAHLLTDPAIRQLLDAVLDPAPSHIVLTGSGSSAYAGESLAPLLQQALGIPCLAIPAGTLLTHAAGSLPAGAGLLISLARSGNSPESRAVVDQVLQLAPAYQHLVVTCNAEGQLATAYQHEARIKLLLLDPRTHDRSLVMTSSFSNLVLGAALLLGRADPAGFAADIAQAAGLAQQVFDRYADSLAAIAAQAPEAVLYLGTGGGIGIAREAALKMLEMSGGQVISMAETYLGLRHGPMSALSRPSLIFAPLSADGCARGYELDLLAELSAKRLGASRIVIGDQIPAAAATGNDLRVQLDGYNELAELPAQLVNLVVAQLLAFFRCMALGAQPDQPSQGILTRVVGEFTLHPQAGI